MSTVAQTDKRIDWQTLEADFVLNDTYTSPRSWLREVVQWSDGKIASGNTQDHITDWGRKRADYQQTLHQDKIKQAREQLSKLQPELYKIKQELLLDLLSKRETMSVREKLSVLRAIKLELDEPLQGSANAKPFSYTIPVIDKQPEMTEEELNEAIFGARERRGRNV